MNMVIVREPLADRLEALHDGYLAHKEYAEARVRQMGEIPLSLYLRNWPEMQERFQELLHITEEKFEQMTYQQAAVLIKRYWQAKSRRRRQYAKEAAAILTLPFEEFYQMLQEDKKRKDGRK